MEILRQISLLPLPDALALLWFFSAWIGYAMFATRRAQTEASLLAVTNHYRRLWMLQTTRRDNRVVDGVVVQNLSTSPSFFASTTILIIGGLLAVLGTSEQAIRFVQEIPYAAQTSAIVFDIKLLLLIGIFVYAFFRFTWSMRQYSFGALLIASAPDDKTFDAGLASREEFANRAGKLVGLAAETFNDGLRAYYLSFSVVLWFFSPLAFAIGAAGVVFLLYWREFHSDVLDVLRG